MKKLLAILFAGLIFCAGVHAQSTKSTLQTSVSTNLPDNTVGAITPAILRSMLDSMILSWQQAPQVRANTGVTDTIVIGDYGFMVTENSTSAVAVSLPQATGSFSTFGYYQANVGSGPVTITPTTSTINGSTTYTLLRGQSAYIISDGVNWQVFAGSQSGTAPVPVSPIAYGAVCDGSAHPLSNYYSTLGAAQAVYPAAVALSDQIDWAAIQKMATAGVGINVSDLHCYMNRQVTVSGISISVVGNGAEKSIIEWPATQTSGGFFATQTAEGQTAFFSGLTLQSDQNGLTGTVDQYAVRVTRNVAFGPNITTRVVLQNMAVRGLNDGLFHTGWKRGLFCTDCVGISVVNTTFVGASGTGGTQQAALESVDGAAIYLTGDGVNVTDVVQIDNFQASWVKYGVYSEANFEGVNVHQPQLVLVNEGVHIQSSTGAGQHTVVNGHINCLVTCITGQSIYGLSIANVVIFQSSAQATNTTTGIYFNSCTYCTAYSNQFFKQGASTYNHFSWNGTTTGSAAFNNQHVTGEASHVFAAATVGTVFNEFNGAAMSATYTGTTSGITISPMPPSATQGDLLYGSADFTLSTLAKNTSATRYLSNTGTSNNPAWAQIDLTNGVTGTLPKGSGGTGTTAAISLISTTLTGVNFNSGNTDNAIVIALPTGFTRFNLFRLFISNASHDLSTATIGVFPTTGGAGTALLTSGSAITVTATTDGTANNMQQFNAQVNQTISWVAASLATPNTVYLRVQTAEGVAATGDVTAVFLPLP